LFPGVLPFIGPLYAADATSEADPAEPRRITNYDAAHV
jgi:hypothetical protein